jgi:hypothetical protein
MRTFHPANAVTRPDVAVDSVTDADCLSGFQPLGQRPRDVLWLLERG